METERRRQALARLRSVAAGIQGIDLACYAEHGRDPREPVLGLGRADAPWCFFGRDPGAREVGLGRPFVGDAGRRIRAVMAECGLDEADVFWMNTVPFKPVGNKPWSMAVRRQCLPALLELLAGWEGTAIVTFGEAACKWFGLAGPQQRQAVERFWGRPDKYEARLELPLVLAGEERRLVLHPLPHPSGANAAWVGRFPGLLKARLMSAAAG